MIKKCNTCQQDKQLDQFYKDKSVRTGLGSQCKQCEAARKRGYYKKNRDKMLADNKNWREDNSDHIKSYEQTNKRRRNKRLRNRRVDCPEYRVVVNTRGRMHNVLNSNNKADTTVVLIGCTPNQLRRHLESQFTDGMSWGNYGLHGWHIDHIKPCASFDMSDPEQQRECFHYTNLQPLWWEDNLAKSDKII